MADAQISRIARAVMTATLAAGATASPLLDLRGWDRVSVRFPSNYVGGTATFKAAVTAGATPVAVYNQSGALVSLPAGASRVVQLPDAVLVGFYGVKVISATKQTVTGGAALLAICAQG